MKDTSLRNEFILSNTKGESVTMLFSAEISPKLVRFFLQLEMLFDIISHHTCFDSSTVFRVTANSINKLLPAT